MKIEQYESALKLFEFFQLFPNIGQGLFNASYDAREEFYDYHSSDWEICDDCGYVKSECECRYASYGGREYDDGDSFED